MGAKGAFRKILGSITNYGYLKIVQRGDTLGRQGQEALKKYLNSQQGDNKMQQDVV